MRCRPDVVYGLITIGETYAIALSECPLRRYRRGRRKDRNGEGFRMRSRVRKPPKHEPAGVRRQTMGISTMGISSFALPWWWRNRRVAGVGGHLVREIVRRANTWSGAEYG